MHTIGVLALWTRDAGTARVAGLARMAGLARVEGLARVAGPARMARRQRTAVGHGLLSFEVETTVTLNEKK